VASVGRRTGRAEQDEHAEGLHYSELELALRPAAVRVPRWWLICVRACRPAGHGDLRPADLASAGSPAVRVRAPLAVKLYGEDLGELRRLADQVVERLHDVNGLADVQPSRRRTRRSCGYRSIRVVPRNTACRRHERRMR